MDKVVMGGIAAGVDIVAKTWDLGVKISQNVKQKSRVSKVSGHIKVMSPKAVSEHLDQNFIDVFEAVGSPDNGLFLVARVSFSVGKSGHRNRSFSAELPIAYAPQPEGLLPYLTNSSIMTFFQNSIKSVSEDIIGCKLRKFGSWNTAFRDEVKTLIFEGALTPFIVALTATNTVPDEGPIEQDHEPPPSMLQLVISLDGTIPRAPKKNPTPRPNEPRKIQFQIDALKSAPIWRKGL